MKNENDYGTSIETNSIHELQKTKLKFHITSIL